MVDTIFLLVVGLNSLAVLGTSYSVFAPSHRIWPPPGRDSWQFWVTWIVITLGFSGAIVVGLLRWGSLGLGYMAARLLLGGALMLVGFLVMMWGVWTLGLRQSLGVERRPGDRWPL